MNIRHALIALAASALIPAVASAHPKLLTASPAAQSTVAAPARIELRFSERLMPKMSGASIVMTGMPGMARHAPMPINGVASSVGKDGKTLILKPKARLTSGTYRIDWHAIAADTHRVTGTHTFAVR